MSAYPSTPLGSCVLRVETWNPLRAAPDEEFRYIDLSAVDQDTKSITEAREISCAEAPSRARQLVRTGDILVSTVRPNLNGVARVSIDLNGATASTGFCVLRPDPEKLSGSYLFHWVKSAAFVGDMVSKATGASYPAVSDRIIFESLFPLPPLEEQRRIAAILDQAETLRTQRRAALALLDRLTQSLFLEMFGDMRMEPDRWPKVPFEAIVRDSRIGLVRGSQELDDSHPYPYLRMNAITRDGELKLEGALRATATAEELEIYSLRHGDFLFNTRNSRELVGKTALFRGDELYLFNNNLLRVRFVESAHPEYVVAAFKTQYIQNELELRKSGTTNVFAVYYKDLRTLPIPLPPLPLQQTFAARIQAIEALKATHRQALAALDALFASLQQRAFAGQL